MYKKNIIFLFMFFMFVILFTGCNGTTQQNEEPKVLDVSIDVHEKINEDGKISFSIDTNLPDETELMLTLIGEANDYRGQGKVTIKNGKGLSETFSRKGEALQTGKYELTVSMSLAKLQSENVQKTVGENGEYLAGELVKKSKSGSCVSASYKFEIK